MPTPTTEIFAISSRNLTSLELAAHEHGDRAGQAHERLSAADCERLGLANRVLPDAGFDAASLDYARRIAAGPPIALRYMKDNLNRALTDSLEALLDIESERMVQSAGTEDYEEAVNAFAEKRAPVFRGR